MTKLTNADKQRRYRDRVKRDKEVFGSMSITPGELRRAIVLQRIYESNFTYEELGLISKFMSDLRSSDVS